MEPVTLRVPQWRNPPHNSFGVIGLSNFEREEEKKEIVLNSDVTNSRELKCEY